jgi:hypothetical protein
MHDNMTSTVAQTYQLNVCGCVHICAACSAMLNFLYTHKPVQTTWVSATMLIFRQLLSDQLHG